MDYKQHKGNLRGQIKSKVERKLYNKRIRTESINVDNESQTSEDKMDKNKAKELYGYLMHTVRSDFDSVEEYKQEKADITSELKEALGVDDLSNVVELLYSKNQIEFISDMENQGLEINYLYSGRGMYGEFCPSVSLDRYENPKTKSNYCSDSLGLGVVYYARN